MPSRPIFIFAQARSGSTLTQRLLNSAPRVLIAGEHLGVLKGVAAAFKDYFHNQEFKHFCSFDTSRTDAMLRARSCLKNPHYFSARINGLHIEDTIEMFETFVRRVSDPFGFRGIWGFKEIRYGFNEDFVFEMLRHLFPESKFILQLRHPAGQARSARQVIWWAGTLKQIAQRWIAQTRMFLKYAKEAPEHVRLLRYEDLIDPSSDAISNIFDWLGLPFATRQTDVIHKIGKVGAGPDSEYSKMTLNQQRGIENRCLLPEFVSLYDRNTRCDEGLRM